MTEAQAQAWCGLLTAMKPEEGSLAGRPEALPASGKDPRNKARIECDSVVQFIGPLSIAKELHIQVLDDGLVLNDNGGLQSDGTPGEWQFKVCFHSGERWVSMSHLQLKPGLPTIAPSPAAEAERSSGSDGRSAGSSSGVTLYPAPPGCV